MATKCAMCGRNEKFLEILFFKVNDNDYLCPTCEEKWRKGKILFRNICPRCNAKIYKYSVKCLSCGLDFTQPYRRTIINKTIKNFCPQCDFELPADSEKCSSCGQIFYHDIVNVDNSKVKIRICPRCSAKIFDDSVKCLACGLDLTKILPVQRVIVQGSCPKCNAEIPIDLDECPSCGISLICRSDSKDIIKDLNEGGIRVEEKLDSIKQETDKVEANNKVINNTINEKLKNDTANEPNENKVEEPEIIKPVDEYKDCPFCAETIKKAAIVCRYCKRDLPSQAKEPEFPEIKVADEKKNEATHDENIPEVKNPTEAKVTGNDEDYKYIPLNEDLAELPINYPKWVKNPKPKTIYSIGFFILVIIVIWLITNSVSAILLGGDYGSTYPQNPIGIYGQFAIKIISGIFGAMAWKPIKTPWWSYIILVLAAFVPILCYVPYFLFGKYLAMRFTKPPVDK